jgi:hypothetical protein
MKKLIQTVSSFLFSNPVPERGNAVYGWIKGKYGSFYEKLTGVS